MKTIGEQRKNCNGCGLVESNKIKSIKCFKITYDLH
mgnify:CR=1 FL=1